MVNAKNRNRYARESQKNAKNFEHFVKTGTPANAVAEADYYLREKMRMRMQAHQHEPLAGYLDRGKSDDTEAHIKLREEFGHNRHLVMQALEGSHNIKYGNIEGRVLINRCFLSQTVEEIMDNLEREGNHPFARKCLDAMKKNDMLSMRLTLRLVREAQNSDYATCLRKEVDVLGNLLKHPNFVAGVKAASAVAPHSLYG